MKKFLELKKVRGKRLNSTNVFYVCFLILITATLLFIGFLPLIQDAFAEETFEGKLVWVQELIPPYEGKYEWVPNLSNPELSWVPADCEPDCEDKIIVTFGYDYTKIPDSADITGLVVDTSYGEFWAIMDLDPQPDPKPFLFIIGLMVGLTILITAFTDAIPKPKDDVEFKSQDLLE